MLMNYQDDYNSVSTLAHEWGHAMHTWLAGEAQPFPSADYDTFMAEVASTFNEALLLDHMLKETQSDAERLYYLGSALESLRGTFFRQAMFAEFELAIHQRVEGGDALTGERLSEMYLELLRAGSSAFSYDLLKDAGVDMATAAPYEAIAARMNAIMDEMEALIAKRPADEPAEEPAAE